MASIQILNQIKKKNLETMNMESGSTKVRILIHTGTCGYAAGARKILEAAKNISAASDLPVDISLSGCIGLCASEPNVTIMRKGEASVIYQKMTPEKMAEVFENHVKAGAPVMSHALACKDMSGFDLKKIDELDFFKSQVLFTMRNKGVIDPESIDEYIARDGYFAALKAVTEMESEQIIKEILASGLRGRGGGGFPTGRKWDIAFNNKSDVKYIICNADEGDPGAFMDRSILESDPHSVLEGMIIAAKAFGATHGYIYCRTEYPLAIKMLEKALAKAREYNFLGRNIFGTGMGLDIEICQGAGAFVCGEETALMLSIEGKRGMPRPRPPYPAQKGLFGKPTVINNVETLSTVPSIIREGAEAYSSMGTLTSKGTKVFAMSGSINTVGLVEIPMGISLRSLIFDICGGIPNKRKFKAVQLGGPSGGCIPEAFLDTPVDYEAIIQAGAIMGSGGVIVMDETSCMVDMARFFIDFIKDESCGKCTPCREGSSRLLEILDRITTGEGKDEDIAELEELSEFIKSTSLCGLGQTAPNPVLSTLRHFRHEYEAHIKDKKCPAKRCASLLEFKVDTEKCTKCGLCFKACPAKAILWQKKQAASIDRDKCTKCLSCYKACRFEAIL
ncbi:NADH-quinone oxidoreductase subunit NuoF [Desulforegula conservatrix]|uniref:NADH-quinone oxidoreductase subunit NuoF n=1 Tax=Desulforegula conservatrix TaxID=153026 RepID=UPI000409CF1F|nr:NADH-quinone oxidoreductase subunit NuoF [Desulforegula conservatrix]